MDTKIKEEQNTPSWKVNLTQKFNSISKKIRPVNKQKMLNFDQQLQQKLSIIPSKEQLSSNHKNQHQKNQRKISKQRASFNNNKNQQKKSIFQISFVTQNQAQKLNFDTESKYKEEQKQNFTFSNHAIYEIFTDRNMADLFIQFFDGLEQVQLSEFVHVCCIKYFPEINFSTQFKQLLTDQMRLKFCTTNQNLISFNAVQMLTKKQNIKNIFQQSIYRIKYKQKKIKLQNQYEKILTQIIDQQNILDLQTQKLNKKKKQLDLQEKQIIKKQKGLKNQQKQLIQKEKLMKKTLQDKSTKLINQMVNQIQKLNKEIDKKANSFQRNAKNKLQLIQKRIHDCKGSSSKIVPQKDNQDAAQKKAFNQILNLRNKLKKMQKDHQNIKTTLQKQLSNGQKQSNSLLKANTILEGKIQKIKAKSKQLSQNLSLKDKQIDQLRFQMAQKTNLISELQNKLSQLSKTKENQFSYKTKDQTLSEKNDPKKLKQFKKNKKADNLIQQSKNCQNCGKLIEFFNQIFGNIMKCFQKKFQSSKPTYKIQEVLINKFHEIFLGLFNIIFQAIKIYQKNINYIVNFMTKNILAKFSLLKFQFINKIHNKNIQSQIERLMVNCIDKKSLKCIFTQLNEFIQQFGQTQEHQNIINLILILGAAGFSQYFDKSRNKSVLILQILHKIVVQEIGKSQAKNKKILKIGNIDYQQSITYLFPKYLSYSSNPNETQIFIQILLQICNFYSIQSQQAFIFKSILTLENFKYLFNYTLMNFSQHAIDIDNKKKQSLENVSIILQRFCYLYGDKIELPVDDLKNLKKIYKKMLKNQKQSQNFTFFKDNLKSILSTFDESDQN